ncbi:MULTISPECIES: hypothetical protein [unclassified Bradyrhizobium]|uniref:hypothetical protein n=1 Tax=unclassified Bradyrhizobium TaxID=2631580 RepID=UPI00247A4B51|nr:MULTISPECIES: hypothetical protein [unclassified Bradyrhizobium]WGS23026.1 hypothetical protein MTX22_16110 [Bradyrhizobium sp. ISRA463]WGS30025.1 hypothetical protein MTX19_13835 [Bradyrhizobium sp. ISRA464]
MIRDGQYAAWFRTPRGEGTGIVYLTNGKISGGDSMFAYGGSYEVDNDRFTATLTTRRYADGPTTVFGCDEVEAQLVGTIRGNRAVCSGTAKQAPGVRFEATLFLQQQEPPPAPGPKKSTPVRTDVTRLPKLPSDRRTANPFASKRFG